ncbi:hypothetical protein BOX15_Mlig019088g2, partial [Macrostomum lignano]
PLVLLCGLPSSGKSTRARQLIEYLSVKFPDRRVSLIDESICVSGSTTAGAAVKTAIYAGAAAEKEARSCLKSETEQRLAASPTDVVILDSLNYIKGYRYELYCSVKHLRHTQCLIHCDVSPETAKSWNAQRPVEDRYPEDLFDQLCARFEEPNATNRWDSPLVLAPNAEPLQCSNVCQALFNRAPDRPNQSTQSRPSAASDFLPNFDAATRDVMQRVMAAQTGALPGDELIIAGCKRRLTYTRQLTMGELQRCRKQFLTGLRSRPATAAAATDAAAVTELFVDYLNSAL